MLFPTKRSHFFFNGYYYSRVDEVDRGCDGVTTCSHFMKILIVDFRERYINNFSDKRCFVLANIYFDKVNNRNTRKRCKTCPKLITKTERYLMSFFFFLVSFEDISPLFLVFLLLTLNK